MTIRQNSKQESRCENVIWQHPTIKRFSEVIIKMTPALQNKLVTRFIPQLVQLMCIVQTVTYANKRVNSFKYTWKHVKVTIKCTCVCLKEVEKRRHESNHTGEEGVSFHLNVLVTGWIIIVTSNTAQLLQRPLQELNQEVMREAKVHLNHHIALQHGDGQRDRETQSVWAFKH